MTVRHQLMFDGLAELNKKYGVFKEVRGDGLLIGCELAAEFAGHGKDLVKAGEVEGLLLLIAGPSVMRLAPSLLITPEDIRLGLERFGTAIEKFIAGVRAANVSSQVAKAA